MELTARSRGCVRRLVAYGLPKNLSQEFILEVDKWETNSGPRWTVNRLKSIKQDILRIRSGLTPLTWMKRNRSGKWYGVWGRLVSLSSSDKGLELVLNVLMYYSTFLAPRPDRRHLEALRSSVGSPEIFLPRTLLEDLANHAQSIVGKLKVGKSISLLEYRGKSSCKSPTCSGSVPQNQFHERELEWANSPEGFTWIWQYPKAYSAVLECLEEPPVKSSIQSTVGSSPIPLAELISRSRQLSVWGGNLIPLNKDGGWKIRWIANPLRIHQLALKPLGDPLYGVLKDLPWDCTYDQGKPLVYLQQHLKSRGRCFAVDLTSATDYFPLSLQKAILDAIFPDKELIQLFCGLSRARWTSPYGDFHWTAGQPMGLYPSFASFALAHGLVLSYLDPRPNQFFVLGDDVVILNPELYQSYLKVLDLLGCPIQPSKTLESDKLTEFAGKIITNQSVLSTYKWRDISSENFLDLMRTFGQKFKPLLKPRERRVYEAVARLLLPYGCNHSTGTSLPLEQVVGLTEEFEMSLPESSGGACYTSFLRWITDLVVPGRKNSLWYEISNSWFQKSVRSLDERTSRAFKDSVFSDFPWKSGITDILERLDLPSDLPALLGETSRTPTLSWYERILGFRAPLG